MAQNQPNPNSSNSQQHHNPPLRQHSTRRQIQMVHNPGQEQRHLQNIIEEVRPALDLIELESHNHPQDHNDPSSHSSSSDYRLIHQNKLKVRLQPDPSQTTKEIIFDKILIFGVVWNKEINGLFDYEEKDKTEKSSIVIEKDVKSHINFVSGNGLVMPTESDSFLLVFKTKDKKIDYEKILLKDVKIAALKRQIPQSKSPSFKDENPLEKEFLCAFKLIMNQVTNKLNIKVFSLDELNSQVKMVTKKIEKTQPRRIQFSEEPENVQIQGSQINSQLETKKQESFQVPSIHGFGESQKLQTLEPYFIIRTLSKTVPSESRGCKIYPGDLLKLGKIEFKVISVDGESIEDKNNEYDRRAIEVTEINEEEKKQVECKYCLGGKSEETDNFFVHLCDCRGHMSYVHYQCLTQWTRTKSSVTMAENVKMYFLEKMKCEVCLKDFPKYIRYDGKLFHILPIELPKKHLMLVDVSLKQDANTAVITGVEDNEIVIGRGRNAHLRITDITVSREHATITKFGDDYFVKDKKSKFGTLIRSSEKEIETEIENKKGFQVNNVIFTVQIMKREVEREQEPQKVNKRVENFEPIKERERIYEENGHEVQDHEQNNAILEEQDEQTRSTKKGHNLESREGWRREGVDERMSEMRRRRYEMRMKEGHQGNEGNEEEENCQNTTNINNGQQNELMESERGEKTRRRVRVRCEEAQKGRYDENQNENENEEGGN